jgi:hypothetical protein
MKKFITISFIPFLIGGLLRANSALTELEYDSSKTYSKGDAVIPSATEFTLYTAKTSVPAGQNGPPNTAYWQTAEQYSTELQSTHSGTVSTPPSSDNINTDEISNLGTPTEITTASGLTSASNEAFVMQQYLDFLGRDGDSEGIKYWTEQLDTGVQSRADCVNNFVFSAEFQQQVAPVSRLYLAYFLRLPDTGGLTYWIDEKLNGKTLNEISNSFAGVQEFSDRYGSLDDSGFVNLVYNNVLSRNPDSDGLAYWNGQMSGGMTRGEVMTGFSESTENQNSTLNQIRVIAFYYGMLKRAPDQGGFDYWVGKLNNGELPNELIDGFIISPEYQGRAEKSASEGGFGK